MKQYFIYLGETPTMFKGIDVNVKKNFAIELDEEENSARIEEFVKEGKLIHIDKKEFDELKQKGFDRRREEVKKFLEKRKIVEKKATKTKKNDEE